MLLGTAVAVLAIPLYRALGARFGGEGLAGAGVLAMSANATLLLVMLRIVHGGPPLLPLIATLARTLAVGVAAAVPAAWAAGRAGPPFAAFAFGTAAFGIVAIPGIWWLGGEEVREVLTRALARLRRRRG
jgi:peptidoglycan biosynthesis protein MviN/MurJ (putative lipid II flippase)